MELYIHISLGYFVSKDVSTNLKILLPTMLSLQGWHHHHVVDRAYNYTLHTDRSVLTTNKWNCLLDTLSVFTI